MLIKNLLTVYVRKNVLSFVVGVVIGVVAGLIGVGGGEFRIPALTYLTSSSMTVVASSNLLIGFFTVFVSFLLRLLKGLASSSSILFGAYLSVGSIVGAYLGALMSGKFSNRALRILVIAYLLIVGLRFTFEPLIGEVSETLLFQENVIPIYLICFGFLVSVLSAMFGVAGGEMRIPILIMAFGLGAKLAGTASLFASIATVGIGFLQHYRMGHFEVRFTWIALFMTIGSILGTILGTFLVVTLDDRYLKLILGVVLIAATLRFTAGLNK
ncbi:MAG: sulfite exporter TauE/SafE family protein [Nitrososphaerales archaeon]